MFSSRGAASPLIITTIILAVLALALVAFGVWSYTNYLDYKNNADAKIDKAVNQAKTAQKTEDEASFAEREKSPLRQFSAPEDFGQVIFDFPKTWSVYIGEEGSRSGSFEVYFHPGAVVSTSKKTPYALRLSIASKAYEEVLKTFQAQINKGDLRASTVTVNNESGTRLDGTFAGSLKGAMVLLKLRDKTIQVYTESEDFIGDFNNIILPSLKFNP